MSYSSSFPVVRSGRQCKWTLLHGRNYIVDHFQINQCTPTLLCCLLYPSHSPTRDVCVYECPPSKDSGVFVDLIAIILSVCRWCPSCLVPWTPWCLPCRRWCTLRALDWVTVAGRWKSSVTASRSVTHSLTQLPVSLTLTHSLWLSPLISFCLSLPHFCLPPCLFLPLSQSLTHLLLPHSQSLTISVSPSLSIFHSLPHLLYTVSYTCHSPSLSPALHWLHILSRYLSKWWSIKPHSLYALKEYNYNTSELSFKKYC